MSEAVLDASVVLKWFRSEPERKVEEARALRARYEAGELYVFAPFLLMIEIVNVAARRWRWSAQQLEQLAQALTSLGFELVEPPLDDLARWTATGLTAYDAAYVVVAERTGVRLITDDAQIVRLAPDVAERLGGE